jgi:hypothetical protein
VDHIHLHHTYLSGKWTLDHVESKYKSICGHTGMIVILNGNLAVIYPTASKGDLDSTESLRRFTEEIRIPANLKCDMAAAFVSRHTDFQRLVQRLGINLTCAKPYRHNQLQQVDVTIPELKRKWCNKMGTRSLTTPMVFQTRAPSLIDAFYPAGTSQTIGIRNDHRQNT